MTIDGPGHGLDAHARPPDELKVFYKHYQKLKHTALALDEQLLDFADLEQCRGLTCLRSMKWDDKKLSSELKIDSLLPQFFGSCNGTVQAYALDDMPGLQIIPNLLPIDSQKSLLDRLIHRDVSDPTHQSNLHLHYDVAYPPDHASFFSLPSTSTEPLQTPKDPTIHRPLSVQQMLNRKLRWITLGGQYDWTNKVYPSTAPPQFPSDIAEFLKFLFGDMMQPEAAIVNFYSPGDTLSLHRDVAEECDRGLISISIGCDGIFILGLEDEKTGRVNMRAMRLRSGDAIIMDGKSRYAWHGVPQIVAGTCPESLQDWPGEDYPSWSGWMKGKRINLNVRQMKA